MLVNPSDIVARAKATITECSVADARDCADTDVLLIDIREPAEYLDTARFEEAGVSAAVCARVGPLDAPFWAGHLIHLCRDTDYGCEMRSRFWLGDFDPPEIAPDAASRTKLFPDSVGEGLLKHCHEEMSYLAGFLPDLHARER